MAEDVAGALSGKVEVGVVCQVDGSGLVGRGPVVNEQGVGVRQDILDGHGKVPRVTFLSILAHVRELQRRRAPLGLHRLGLPDDFVKALLTSMEVVLVIVSSQRVFPSGKGELPFGDAVAVAADERLRSREYP